MKKLLKTFTTLILSVVTVLTFFACGDNNTVKPWGNKIRIDVSLYSGGYGTDWFIELADKFNSSQDKYYINKLPDNKTDIYSISQKIIAGIIEADIFIVNSSDIGSLINNDKLIDLTEIYGMKHEGEDTTVKDKIYDYNFYYDSYSKDGRLYALPYTDGISGIIYDHDLFEKKGLLLRDNSTESGLTKGRDGLEGTYDDGLPVTYEEFKNLVERIKYMQMIPFVVSDSIETGLTEPIAETIWAQYDGITNYKISFSYNGTYVMPSTGAQTEITPETGYKLFSEGLMEGRLKSATFFKEMLLDSDNTYNRSGMSHTDAQGVFLTSHATKRIAMLLDGAWWENEAKPSFAADARNTGEQWAYGNRDFRMMPLPSFEGESKESSGKNYFCSYGEGSVFALKQDDKEKEAGIIEFLKEYTKDENLRNFTKSSGAKLPFIYDYSDEDIKHFTPFTKNMLEIMSSPSTQIIRGKGYTFIYNYRKPLRWEVRINGTTASSLMNTMRKGSVSDYALALKNMFNSENWATAIA